jgi:hypothetical protein
MVDAGDRHAPRGHRLRQHPEAAQVGDIQHHDDIRGPQRLHRFGAPVDLGKAAKEKIESRRGDRRIRDQDVDADSPEHIGQADLAAQAVSIGIDVGGEADPPPRHKQLGKSGRGGELFGGKSDRHRTKVSGER